MTETDQQNSEQNTGAEKAPRVFVSHASPDAAVAQRLVAALEREGIRCWIAPRDVPAGAQYADAIVRAISAALGMRTLKAKSSSRPAFGTGKGPSTSETERARPLMLPQEVKEMGIDKELVFYENLRPIQADKIRYYADPLLAARVRPPPDVPIIIDSSKPHAPSPARPKQDPGVHGLTVEKIEAGSKPRRGKIRPKQKMPKSRLAAMDPPIDAAAVEAGVAAYLARLTVEDTVGPGGSKEPTG